MDIYSIINTIVTIVLGGGWFIYYKANKKKRTARLQPQRLMGGRLNNMFTNTPSRIWKSRAILSEKTGIC